MSNKSFNNANLPDFNVHDIFGNNIKLSSIKSDYVLLVFLRYSGCPWCNLALHRLALEYDTMAQYNCQIVSFIQSGKDNIVKNIYDRHNLKPQFPIIADHAMAIYKKYNVDPSVIGTAKATLKIPYWIHSVKKHGFKQTTIDGNFFLVPAWFLINNRTKKIIKSKRGISFYNHDSFIDIYDSIIFRD